MDFGAIGAAVTSLRLAGDIAKGLMSVHTMAEVQSVAIQLNEKIIDAQHRIFEANAAQSALVERIRDLEGQIAEMKGWGAQEERYQLVAPYAGCTVYALKEAMSKGETPHYLCANCFQQRKRSFLQVQKKALPSGISFVHYVCSACKTDMATRNRDVGPAQYAEKVTAQT